VTAGTPAPLPSIGPGRLIGPSFTDVAGEPGTRPQFERLCGRYFWVREYCAGRDVVEVACGSGQGLGLLARTAGRVVGGDYSAENLAIGRATYGGRVQLTRLDAHELPFRAASVDVVALLETLYFLPRPDSFIAEAARVLRPGGHLLVSVINRDCWDFNPSPLYPGYFGARELTALLARHGFATECFGAFPLDRPSLRQRVFRPLKRAAIALNLIPTTVQARLWLKRIAIGKLMPLPFEILPDSASYQPPVPVAGDQTDPVHQVVLAAGRKPGSP
jgi:SAM-dependent methyltransferase